jgi:hypothetical protein
MPVARKLKTPEGRLGLEKDYYEAVWTAQASGKTAAQADTLARKRLRMTPDEVFQMKKSSGNPFAGVASNADEAIKRLNSNGMTRFSKGAASKNKAVQAFEAAFTPIDARIRQINPWVAQRLRNADGNVIRKTEEYHQGSLGFIKGYKKTPKKDRLAIDLALANNDIKGARALYATGKGAVKKGEDFDKMIKTLEKMGKNLKKAGVDYKGIADYFPRHVNDLKGLKKYLERDMKDVGWKKAKKLAIRRNGGKQLTEAQEIKVLNNYMARTDKPGVKKLLGATKRRRVGAVTADMHKFYGDAVTALDIHIRQSAMSVERHNLFGKDMKMTKDGLEDINTSIGEWLTKQGIPDEQIDQIRPLLQARFGKGEEVGAGLLATMRQGVGGVTLGNPLSAMRQLGDNFVAAWQYGLIPTMQSMPKAAWNTFAEQALKIRNPKEITADMYGMMSNIAQELDTGGVGSRLIKNTAHGMYKWGGFKTIDRLGKNVLIQTALRTSAKMQHTQKGREAFIKKYGASYDGQEIQMLMADLKSGKPSDIVKQHIMAEVMEIQPISRSQMPQMYLNHPNGRIMYQFRTWGIKQLDLVRRQIFEKMLSPKSSSKERLQGAASLALYASYVGTGNVAITELQRLVTGRDSKLYDIGDIGGHMIEQMVANIGVNRYGLEKMIVNGDMDAFAGAYLMPPSLAVPGQMAQSWAALAYNTQQHGWDSDEAQKWKTPTVKSTGIGRLVNYWILGGYEEENEKLAKERRANRSQAR